MNTAVSGPADYAAAVSRYFPRESFDRARSIISRWPGYQPSPLRSLDGLASALGIEKLYYKDESERFGLGSFKPLGGAYAVTRLLQKIILQRHHFNADPGDLLQGKYADYVGHLTVTAATDGNHGRSVAWGAQRCGCHCVIYIHQHVSKQREQAILDLGASVTRVAGNYDDSVRQAYQRAEAPDWYIIQDTTDGTAAEITLDVMHGYTLMADEAIEQLTDRPLPTHQFLQAGVGGMAAAVLARFWFETGQQRPVTVLAEPTHAACCFLSLSAGRPEIAEGDHPTIMAGLACGEISSLAWEVLKTGAQAALTLADDSVRDCMQLLADRRFGDPAIVAGESAVAGLVGLIAVMKDQDARNKLGLDRHSRVIVYGTEGATDPQMYRRIVGRSAQEVLHAG